MAHRVQHQPPQPAPPQHPPRQAQRRSYSVSTPGPTSGLSAASSAPVPIFRAPAHKHAHHLHSIPPREKSTRTLIIDHMLWVHGRTRFAQARAELGMTDRTGGPSSANYTHRRRPENYDEDDEEGSEGEQVDILRARGDPDHPQIDDEEERLGRQDLPLARSLRLRAEGLEKVVTSMLDQPPPVHPIPEDEFTTPPTSPRSGGGAQNGSGRRSHPHTLPNGVRLRLALGTVINDLFARQAPPPPYRHQQLQSQSCKPPAASSSATVSAASRDQCSASSEEDDHLPLALATLRSISAASRRSKRAHRRRHSSVEGSEVVYGLHTQDTPHFHNNASHGHHRHHPPPYPYPPPPTKPDPRTLPLSSIKPDERVKDLYLAGADPSTANSPPALRCPRHLHTGCQICVEAKSPVRPSPSVNTGARGRAGSSLADVANRAAGYPSTSTGAGPSSSSLPPSSSSASASGPGAGGLGAGVGGMGKAEGGAIGGWQDGSGIGSGLLRHGVKGSVLRRRNPDNADGDAGRPGSGPGTGTSVGAGTGSGSGSRSRGAGPGRAAGTGSSGVGAGASAGASAGVGKWTGSGNAKLSSLIPRFIRLSALAAMELGNEIKDAEEEDKQRQAAKQRQQYQAQQGGQGQNQSQVGQSQQQRDAQAQAQGQRPMQPPRSPLRRQQLPLQMQHQQQLSQQYYQQQTTRQDPGTLGQARSAAGLYAASPSRSASVPASGGVVEASGSAVTGADTAHAVGVGVGASTSPSASASTSASALSLPPPSIPLPPPTSTSSTGASNRPFEYALRPTREWYLLLAGLLTRAVLEGYLTAGWRGFEAVECLLSVGLGEEGGVPQLEEEESDDEDDEEEDEEDESDSDDEVEIIEPHIQQQNSKNENKGKGREKDKDKAEDEFLEFEPDEMPGLDEAVGILFPGFWGRARTRRKTRRKAGGDTGLETERQREDGGEEGDEKTEHQREYEREMKGRLWRFYDIPESTPDLSTHMEDLAWQFPAEPIERAAVRFCEAVARWRGKPELESRPPPSFQTRSTTKAATTSPATSVESIPTPTTTTTTTTVTAPQSGIPYGYHPLQPPSQYQQDLSMYQKYQQMPPPPLPLTPSMNIESLVHSSPISSGMPLGSEAAGNVYSYYHQEEAQERWEREEKERKAREEIERRKRLKKPSIDVYFIVPEGWTLSSASSAASGMGSVGPRPVPVNSATSAQKRPRSPERNQGYVPSKRLHV